MKNIWLFSFLCIVALLSDACLEDSGELADTANIDAATLTVNPGGTVVRGVTQQITFPVVLTTMSDPGLVQSVDVILNFNGMNNTVEHMKVLTLTNLPAEVTFTLDELLSQAGLTVDQLNARDSWTYSYMLNNATGNPWKILQETRFTYICPSSLAGAYRAVSSGTSTDDCCLTPVDNITATVQLTETGPGVYELSDFTGGLYLEWYDVYGITRPEDSPGNLEHICGEVRLVQTVEPFGTAVSGTGTYNDVTGEITYSWQNGYGDTGTVTLTPL